ncbi:hypothetical protein RRG37_04615 [Mycoplasmopsis felis]|uniref:hypothetical protein n=1 Tax=Mycoplasmopsis felis TaxID=33923 RepID=UPI002AFE96C9|nr:hypothetical protein [Mycoplasmopsis felis]WQQ06168.1 hypothetical protein RRG40_03665 [Mycoplasmopsis felis]
MKIEENFRTLKNNLAIRPMYVFTDDHIEAHLLLCFMSLFILKILLLMLKRFYDNYGILGKLTEDVIIKIFKDLNFIATTDLTTNKIIKKEKIDNDSFFETWDLYSNIQAFIKNI